MSLSSSGASLALALFLAGEVATQCAPQLTSLLPRAGVDGAVQCGTLWDPDGPGPLAARWAVGGTFTVAGGTMAARLAVFDFATNGWSTLGTGFANAADWYGFTTPQPSAVGALLALPNGDLIAGGFFTHADGRAATNIARWDGVAWRAMGSGLRGGVVAALAVMPNGDVVAAGSFTNAGPTSVNGIARWNGVAWQPMGSGLGSGQNWSASALCVRGNGELLAANSSLSPPFGFSSTVQRWTGTAWVPFPANVLRTCEELLELPNGDVLAAGTAASGVHAVLEWNGAAWAAFGTGGPVAAIGSLCPLPNGNLLAAGFANGTIWSIPQLGGTWSTLATATGGVTTIAPVGGSDFLVAGAFTAIAGTRLDRVARYSGGTWQDPDPNGCNGVVRAVVATPAGHVVGGDFTRVGGIAANGIAEWNGVAWQALGVGVDGSVAEVVRLSNGDVVARGSFTTAGAVAVPGLARWNGVNWSSLGYTGNAITRMRALPNGDLLVADLLGTVGGSGTATVRRWNGAAWTTLPGTAFGAVTCLLDLPNGDLVAAGWFTFFGVAANRIARFDGTAWSPIGAGLDRPPNDLVRAANGDLLAGGSFFPTPTSNHVAMRWNGTAWQPVGAPCAFNASKANVLAMLPNDEVLAAGGIPEIGNLPMRNLVRFSQGAWWNVGATPAPYYGTSGDATLYGGQSGVLAKAELANGDLLLAGTFSELAGVPAAGLLRLTPGCAPTVGSLPTGCLGPAGPLQASATNPPTVGGTFTTQCTGFTATSVAVALFGLGHLNPPLPLANATPLGLVGCLVLPTLDYQPFVLPAAGVAVHGLGIANTPSLVGTQLWHQFVQADFTVAGLSSLSVSNGLQVRLQ